MVYPCNLNLIKNEGDTVVFLSRKSVFFLSIAPYKQEMRNAHVYLRREPAIENQQFMETKILMFNIHTLSDKAFKGTFVNLTIVALRIT